jgi:hypothetical protein
MYVRRPKLHRSSELILLGSFDLSNKGTVLRSADIAFADGDGFAAHNIAPDSNGNL